MQRMNLESSRGLNSMPRFLFSSLTFHRLDNMRLLELEEKN